MPAPVVANDLEPVDERAPAVAPTSRASCRGSSQRTSTGAPAGPSTDVVEPHPPPALSSSYRASARSTSSPGRAEIRRRLERGLDLLARQARVADRASSSAKRPSRLAPARSDASRTRVRAAVRPSRSVRSSAIRSAAICPPVRSRFARIRAASTSSPSSEPARAAAAPPAYCERAGQRLPLRLPGPAARSCSWRVRAASTDAWPERARRRRGPSSRRPRCASGASPSSLRRPLPRCTSAISVCASSNDVERDLRHRLPRRSSSAAPSSAIRTRFVCQGSSRPRRDRARSA